jgi:hypothetical protein
MKDVSAEVQEVSHADLIERTPNWLVSYWGRGQGSTNLDHISCPEAAEKTTSSGGGTIDWPKQAVVHRYIPAIG